jgi:hypothetical protein
MAQRWREKSGIALIPAMRNLGVKPGFGLFVLDPRARF